MVYIDIVSLFLAPPTPSPPLPFPPSLSPPRYHKIGLLVLFLQDIGDISLEAAKIAYYFKNLGGKDRAVPEAMANVLFGIFTVQQ